MRQMSASGHKQKSTRPTTAIDNAFAGVFPAVNEGDARMGALAPFYDSTAGRGFPQKRRRRLDP